MTITHETPPAPSLATAENQPRRPWFKIALALGAAASLAGVGVFASFTDTETASAQVTIDSGVIAITEGASGTIGTPIENIEPGSVSTRTIQVDNTGTQQWTTFTLGLTSTQSTSPYYLDPDGLSFTLTQCDVAPVDNACSGTETPLATGAPDIRQTYDLVGTAPAPGATVYYLATFALPESAGDQFQGETTTVDYVFNVTGA